MDNLYGFLHLLNPSKLTTRSAKLICNFATEIATQFSTDITESSSTAELATYAAPRSNTAILADKHLEMAHDWLISMEQLDSISDHEYSLVIHYMTGFFINGGILWKHDPQGAHKRVLYQNQYTEAMAAAHNDTGHHGFYVTHMLITEHYWWPFMGHDIAWYVQTCHICQTRQTRQIAIPPVVAMPAPLFAKMYMDTMHLPQSGSFSYIIQGCCSLTHYLEFRMLWKETAQAIGDWIFQDILQWAQKLLQCLEILDWGGCSAWGRGNHA